MSDLRKKLDAAKSEYQSMRYPGDLAKETLIKPRRAKMELFIQLGALAAMAAAIVIAARLRMSPQSTPKQTPEIQVATNNGESSDTTADESTTDSSASQTQVATFGELPAMSLPQGVSESIDLAPAPPDFSFSPPSFSLISTEQETSTTSTTRESV